MKHLDEYRSSGASQLLVEKIKAVTPNPVCLMEVCGGQTHSLLNHGITQALQGHVEFVHGPGCPVCVTNTDDIDLAIELAFQPDTRLATFGDMLRVPGTHGTLAQARSQGAQVQMVYSPLDVVQLARADANKRFIFFAVGFETTIPTTALAIQQAAQLGLENFQVLCCHVRVQPAMEIILKDRDCRIDGFLAAGHVCSVHGSAVYEELVARYQIPIIIAGFEPLDLLTAVLASAIQIQAGEFRLENHYTRYVERQGNSLALKAIDQIFSVSDCPWRGLGLIANGGFEIRNEFSAYDARKQKCHNTILPQTFSTCEVDKGSLSECPSGEVLRGKLKPCDCPHFGGNCTPEHPLGAPMVSSEGACAAYYQIKV